MFVNYYENKCRAGNEISFELNANRFRWERVSSEEGKSAQKQLIPKENTKNVVEQSHH